MPLSELPTTFQGSTKSSFSFSAGLLVVRSNACNLSSILSSMVTTMLSKDWKGIFKWQLVWQQQIYEAQATGIDYSVWITLTIMTFKPDIWADEICTSFFVFGKEVCTRSRRSGKTCCLLAISQHEVWQRLFTTDDACLLQLDVQLSSHVCLYTTGVIILLPFKSLKEPLVKKLKKMVRQWLFPMLKLKCLFLGLNFNSLKTSAPKSLPRWNVWSV